MIVCETILITMIAALGIYVTITDIRNGVIQNKALIISFFLGIIVNTMYLSCFALAFLKNYIVNLLIVGMLAILLYAFHFWAAGDSKLLICMTMLFPARLYDNGAGVVAPGIIAIIFIFLLAYIYVIIDSVIQFMRREKFYTREKIAVKQIETFIKNYLISFLYLRGISEVLKFLFHDIYYENQIIFSFINIFIALLIYQKNFFRKWYSISGAILLNIVFIGGLKVKSFDIKIYVILLLVLVLRYLVSGYNYKTIAAEDVKEGMVLSYGTIAKFMVSRVKNLPKSTSEDMKSRLSADEVEAVLRWKNSKYGEDSVVIVRKIPFAIFIVAGEICYFLVRVI